MVLKDSIAIVLASIEFVRLNIRVLWSSLRKPIIISIFLILMVRIPNIPQALLSMLSLGELFFYAVIAVGTHRLVLLGEGASEEWENSYLTLRECNYFFYGILLVFFLLPAAFLTFIPFVGDFLSLIAMVYTLARLSPILPSIAIDQKIDINTAWEMSKEHQWVLFFAVGLYPILLGIISVLIAFVPYFTIVASFFDLFTTVLTVASLSIAFKFINNENQREEASTI